MHVTLRTSETAPSSSRSLSLSLSRFVQRTIKSHIIQRRHLTIDIHTYIYIYFSIYYSFRLNILHQHLVTTITIKIQFKYQKTLHTSLRIEQILGVRNTSQFFDTRFDTRLDAEKLFQDAFRNAFRTELTRTEDWPHFFLFPFFNRREIGDRMAVK